MPPSDDTVHLTQAAARGDRAAVEELLQRNLPQLRAFVRLRFGATLRARESGSDLVQSVCREVLEQLDEFRFSGESAFRKWLFTKALRKISHRARHYRTLARDMRREVPLAASDADWEVAACYRSFTSPSQAAATREEMERVEAAFDHLTEKQREVVTLAYLLDMPRAEIAERLGSTEGAVRVLLHRALVELSRRLG